MTKKTIEQNTDNSILRKGRRAQITKEKTVGEKYGFLLGVMWNIKSLAIRDGHTEILEQIQRGYEFTEHSYLNVKSD